MRCTVFGTGYLGATHAVGMAELGHDVIGVALFAGCQRGRAGCGVQARVRRRPRLARTERGRNAATHGATVNVYDPQAMENSRRVFPTLNYSTSVMEACDRADAVLVLTEWNECLALQPEMLAEVVHAKVVVDGRNCLDSELWRQAGWRLYALGRSDGAPFAA